MAYARLIFKALLIPSDAPPNRRATDVIRSVKLFKHLALQISITGLLLCVMFAGLQFNRILDQYEAVATPEVWAWLIWDYLLVMYMITLSSIGHVFLSWRGGLPKEITDRDDTGITNPTD